MWSDPILGQYQGVGKLNSLIQTPSPILIHGVSGVGKRLAASLFCRHLLCSTKEGSVCKCKSCVLLKAGAHPDYHILSGRVDSVGVGTIRDILDRLAAFPVLGLHVVFLDSIEGFTTAALNGLLKTLEEHPCNIRFVLTCSDLSAPPPAVLSRCFHVRFDPLPLDTLFSRLCELEKDPSLARLYAGMAEGSLGEAVKCWKSNQKKTRDICVELLNWLDKKDFHSIFSTISGMDADTVLPNAVRYTGQIISDGTLPAPRIHVDLAEFYREVNLDFVKLWGCHRSFQDRFRRSPNLNLGTHWKGFFLAYSSSLW